MKSHRGKRLKHGYIAEKIVLENNINHIMAPHLTV